MLCDWIREPSALCCCPMHLLRQVGTRPCWQRHIRRGRIAGCAALSCAPDHMQPWPAMAAAPQLLACSSAWRSGVSGAWRRPATSARGPATKAARGYHRASLGAATAPITKFVCGDGCTSSVWALQTMQKPWQVVCAHGLVADELQSRCWAVARCSLHGLWLDGLLPESLCTDDSCGFVGTTEAPSHACYAAALRKVKDIRNIRESGSQQLCRLTGSDTSSWCDTEPGRVPEAGFVVLFAAGAFGIEKVEQINAMQGYGANGSSQLCIAAASRRPGATASPGPRNIAAARPGTAAAAVAAATGDSPGDS